MGEINTNYYKKIQIMELFESKNDYKKWCLLPTISFLKLLRRKIVLTESLLLALVIYAIV